MPYKFNPLTGALDYYEVSSSADKISKKTIKAILIESTYDVDEKKANILFDSDSILYNDDEEL